MRFVTFATDDPPRLGCLLASCRHHGIPLERLGAGRPFLGHGTKIACLDEFCAALPPDELVLYVDASDVLWLRPADGLEATFAAGGADIVFAAEQYFLFQQPGKFRQWRRHPAGRPPFPLRRFLNAGTFAGRADALRRLFAACAIRPETHCDQTLFSARFIAGYPGITLDYAQRLFACTGGREGLEDTDYALADGRLVDRHTGAAPYVIHFSGRNFVAYSRIHAQLALPDPPPKPDGEDWRRYRSKQRLNRFGARLGLDNYGRHLVEHTLRAAAIAFAIAAGALLAWRLF